MTIRQPPSIPPCQGGGLSAPTLDQGARFETSPDKGMFGGVETNGTSFLPYNKKLTVLARENRKNPTWAEAKIWNEVLRSRQFAGLKFLRQKPLAGYIVDFYCSELRLVIEIDGDSHAETAEYDAERTRLLQSLGLTVVRYSNDEVLSNIEGVHSHLSETVARMQPPSIPPCQGGGSPDSPSGQMGRLEASPDKGRFGGV